MSNFEKTNSDPQNHSVTLTIIVVQIMCECVYQFICMFHNLVIFYISASLSSCLMSMDLKEDIRSSGYEVKDVCESTFGYWELTLGTTD